MTLTELDLPLDFCFGLYWYEDMKHLCFNWNVMYHYIRCEHWSIIS